VLLELAGDRADDAPLFRDWNNRPCSTRGLRGILQRLARRAAVELPERPLHAFRHYAARQWVKAKVPDLVIRQLMRHEALSTTQIYTELSAEELAELHAEASAIPQLLDQAGLKQAA
jgi:site-specific recombinase XerD